MGLTFRGDLDRPLNITEIDDNFRYFTGSHAVTGSVTATQGFVGSLTGSVSGSALTAETASYAVAAESASYALTASYALNGGGGAAFPYVGEAEISGTLYMSGSIIPATDGVSVTSSFDLGSATNAWKDIYVSNGSIKFVSSGSTVSLGVTEEGSIASTKLTLQDDFVQGNDVKTPNASTLSNKVFLAEAYLMSDAPQFIDSNTELYTSFRTNAPSLASVSASIAAIDNTLYFVDANSGEILDITASVILIEEPKSGNFTITVAGNVKDLLKNANADKLILSLAENSLPTATKLYENYKPSFAHGYQTHATSPASHAEGDTTFATSKYSNITNLYTGSGWIYVDDKSPFGVGDEVVYVWSAGGNVNQIVRGVVTAVSESSEAVNVSGSLQEIAQDSSQWWALMPDTSSAAIGTLINLSDARANSSHAEGSYTLAAGINSHAEGRKTAAIGAHSHAEGVQTRAEGQGSHAQGYATVAYNSFENVCGQWNAQDDSSMFSVGIGSSEATRANAFTVTSRGSIKLPRTITTTTPEWVGEEGEMVFYNTGVGGSYGFCIFLGGAWRSGSLS